MLSQARADQLLAGQRQNARNIYTHIPITEAWSVSQIATDIGRGGMRPPLDVLQGCLASLKDAGLIRELASGFIRAPVKPEPAPRQVTVYPKEQKPIMTAPAPAVQATPQTNIVAAFGKIADTLRTQAAAMTEAADEIENLAVDIGDRLSKEDPEIAKLRRLATAIKDLA